MNKIIVNSLTKTSGVALQHFFANTYPSIDVELKTKKNVRFSELPNNTAVVSIVRHPLETLVDTYSVMVEAAAELNEKPNFDKIIPLYTDSLTKMFENKEKVLFVSYEFVNNLSKDKPNYNEKKEELINAIKTKFNIQNAENFDIMKSRKFQMLQAKEALKNSKDFSADETNLVYIKNEIIQHDGYFDAMVAYNNLLDISVK
jgi:hypothetical protein